MARIFQVNVECECGMKNPVTISKPDFFKPTVGTCECPDCGSTLKYIIKKHGVINKNCDVYRQVLKESDTLRLMRIEAEQEKRNADSA